jgi:WhiB family redox-sensing transcriptional regulator
MSWVLRAACRGVDPEFFFPPNGNENRFAKAIKICSTCPVQAQCLELTMRLDDRDDAWGIFGGKTPRERRIMREERRKK